MTPIARLLRQKPTLCLYAFERTRDLNEAHLIIHGVMTHALSRIAGPEQDLGPAMTQALDARDRRLACVEALT